MSVFKPALADALIAELDPIRKRYEELVEDQEYVESVIAEGRERTLEEAMCNVTVVKTVVGLMGFTVCLQRRVVLSSEQTSQTK